MKPTTILSVLIFILSNGAFAQMDTAKYFQQIEELEKKLSYTYYNRDQRTWYINRFSYDGEMQMIRFKSTSSKKPMLVIGKKYTERHFKLEDLNPYKITKEPVNENQGLIVRGQLIRLETVKHEKLIGKTINGEPATAQSYIHFSIPQYLEDSIPGYSEGILASLQEIVQFATNIRNFYDPEKNENMIFDLLLGEHVSGNKKRFTERQTEYLLSFEEYEDRRKMRTGFIGHDPIIDRYYEMLIEATGEMTVNYYRVDMTSPNLVLKSIDEGNSRQIVFVNRSLYQYKDNGVLTEYRPSGSF